MPKEEQQHVRRARTVGQYTPYGPPSTRGSAGASSMNVKEEPSDIDVRSIPTISMSGVNSGATRSRAYIDTPAPTIKQEVLTENSFWSAAGSVDRGMNAEDIDGVIEPENTDTIATSGSAAFLNSMEPGSAGVHLRSGIMMSADESNELRRLEYEEKYGNYKDDDGNDVYRKTWNDTAKRIIVRSQGWTSENAKSAEKFHINLEDSFFSQGYSGEQEVSIPWDLTEDGVKAAVMKEVLKGPWQRSSGVVMSDSLRRSIFRKMVVLCIEVRTEQKEGYHSGQK